MTREQFEHIIRAAGAVLGVAEVLVIGSQAIHGSMDGNLPTEASRSVEVDVAVRGDRDGKLADLIDGSIGEASMFHDTFGYYAQGVVESTARLPVGWEARDAVPLQAARHCQGTPHARRSRCCKPSLSTTSVYTDALPKPMTFTFAGVVTVATRLPRPSTTS